MVEHIWSLLAEGDGDLVNSKISLVPLFGEVISVINKTVSSPNRNGLPTLKVLRLVVVNFTHVHAWAVSQDWSFCELLSLKEHREGILSVVRFKNLFNLDRVV